MQLTQEDQTLAASFRSLDAFGKNGLPCHASQVQRMELAASGAALSQRLSGQRGEGRRDTASEPIFTE